ncbi:hypothetical protein FOA52_007083 [Chlamydomonas sp. UWO 241]|nr:hypothetical protein FOA52_007083 [Chlamydomonas sp. UWO 241]
MREAYRRKLEACMRDIGDMSRAVAIMQDDPKTGLKVTPEDLFKTFQKLTDENLAITADREREMRDDLDDLHGRHVELKRKFRTLYLGYRQLRYLVEDTWPNPGNPPRPEVPTEDEVLQAAFEDISRSEEEADRRLVLRLRERVGHQDSQLAAIKIAQAAGEKGVQLRPTDYSSKARQELGGDKFVENPTAAFESEKLREELERMKRLMGGGAGGGANERLLGENAQLIKQIKTLSSDKNRAQLAAELAKAQTELEGLRKGGASFADPKAVANAVREFSNKTAAELERKLAHAEARRVMSEEQLESMQKYLTQSTMQYQREIVRLRSVIGQLDPRMLKANPLKGTR